MGMAWDEGKEVEPGIADSIIQHGLSQKVVPHVNSPVCIDSPGKIIRDAEPRAPPQILRDLEQSLEPVF